MAKADKTISIPALNLREMRVQMVGRTPLICSNGKAATAALSERMKGPRPKKPPTEARDSKSEYESSFYVMPDGKYGFPASGIKRALRDGGSRFSGEFGTVIVGALQIPTEFVEIKGAEPYMKEDYVRHGGRTSDLAYRACFPTWSMWVPIVHNASVLGQAQVLNLFQIAGFAIGIGAWRVERNGTFGQFTVGEVEGQE